MTGPEHHDVAAQVGSGTVPDRLRLDHNAAAAPEPKQIQAAEGGGVLVLLADRLFKNFHLNIAGLLSKLTRGDALATEGVERVEQPHCKGARSPHAGRGRHVGNGTDENRRLDVERFEALPGNVVLDLPNKLDLLRPRVVEPDRLVEDVPGALHSDVKVFVNCPAQAGALLHPRKLRPTRAPPPKA